MKKILILATLFGFLLQFNFKLYAADQKTVFYVDAMYTDFSVLLYDGVDPVDEANITAMIEKLSHLADNFTAPNLTDDKLDNDLANIVTINEKAGVEAVVVDPMLYDMLKEAVAYYDDMNGYFNPAMGHVIDTWKSVINNRDYALSEISPALYHSIMSDLDSLNTNFVITDIVFDDEDKSVFLTKSDLKLDLGAFAKGYAADMIENYLDDKGINHYIINAGESTLSLGTHPDDETSDRPLSITLRDPQGIYQTSGYKGYYGVLYVRNKAISTSGNHIQYVTYQGKKLHHIISPFDLIPMDYYHSVTLVGDDAGLLDALSTAIFNMPFNEAKAVLDALDVEGIFYMKDGSIETHNLIQDFTMGELIEADTTRDLSGLYMILGGVIIIGGALFLLLSLKDKKTKGEPDES